MSVEILEGEAMELRSLRNGLLFARSVIIRGG